MQVIHKQIYTRGIFGGISNTTLCGRLSHAQNDYNTTNNIKDITCKLCLAIHYNPKHWRHKQVLPDSTLTTT